MAFKFSFLFLVLAFLPLCFGQLNLALQQDLINQAKDSALFRNRANRAIFDKAVAALRAKFSTCAANVCFAMDGSASISDQEYELQQSFVAAAVAILGGYANTKVAVVEYGGIIDPIFPLGTPNDFTLIDILTDTSLQSILTFVGPALGWCEKEFRKMPNAVQKMVILGDGQSSLGDIGRFGFTRFGAVGISRAFIRRSVGNDVCAAIIGRGNVTKNRDFFLAMVLQRRNRVFGVPRWLEILNLIDDLFNDICS